MSRKRRMAAVWGGCAAAIPGLVTLGRGHGSSATWIGLGVGVVVGVAVVALAKARKA